jgi:DUF4097 and DUF4098 domain-containing protein YvlB
MAVMLIQKIIGLFVVCIISVPLAASDRKAYPLDVSTAGAEKIIFDVQEGSLILRGDPQAKDVRMMVSIDRMWIFKLGEENILKRLITISGERTPEVTIRTDIPRGISNFGGGEYPIDFEVIVPDHLKLDVRDTSGKIQISDMKGDVSIQDGSGSLALRNLSGKVILKKKSGDVKISDIRGAMTIESESGQMDIRRVGTLDISDANGNLTIMDAASARVRSRGGNVRISDMKGDLEIDDESGEIILLRIAGKTDVRDTSGPIRTEHTGPLRIHDSSGDITVRRAASLDVITKESGRIAVDGIAGPVSVPPGFKVNQLK